MRTWVNGRLLSDPEAPVVGASDHGLTVGDGVFEVLKVVDGQTFALDQHLARLVRSAEGLGLPTVDVDGGPSRRRGRPGRRVLTLGRVRITWTGGPSPLGSDRGGGPPSLVVVAAPMDPWPDTTAVVTVPWPRNERGRPRRPQDHVVRRERARPGPGA